MAGAAGGGLAGAGGLPVRVFPPCPGQRPRVHGHEADNNPDKAGPAGGAPGAAGVLAGRAGRG